MFGFSPLIIHRRGVAEALTVHFWLGCPFCMFTSYKSMAALPLGGTASITTVVVVTLTELTACGAEGVIVKGLISFIDVIQCIANQLTIG